LACAALAVLLLIGLLWPGQAQACEAIIGARHLVKLMKVSDIYSASQFEKWALIETRQEITNA
jgi:hypothetical protein